MDPFAVSHFSHDALLHDLKSGAAGDCMSLAVRLTRIAEVEARRLHLREGYPSMTAYCVGVLHLSDDAAYERVRVARTARQFPGILMALADGRLHLRAVRMLRRHLTSANVDELVAAATHKSRIEIEELLARRFPQPDLPERLEAIPAPSPFSQTAPPQADPLPPWTSDASCHPAPQTVTDLSGNWGRPQLGRPSRIDETAIAMPQASPPTPASPLGLARVEAPVARARMTPLAPERFGLQFTLDREAHDLLEEARTLEGHRNPTGEILVAFKNAFRCYVGELRKQKFAATEHPRHSRPGSSVRHIPAAVKRAVRERDGGQCAFVSDTGHRCPSRRFLEFDHAEPVARGGEATVENVRLLCRAHNLYAAECTFGAEFMSDKREEARACAVARKQLKARAAGAG